MSAFASHFPRLSQSDEIYLDNAATTQRELSSLEVMNDYYHNFNANVHRGTYKSAQDATNAYEAARSTIAQFINAPSHSDVVFTSGATESLNIVALGLQLENVDATKIVVCRSEHHANLLPWQALAAKYDLDLVAIELNNDASFCSARLEDALSIIDEQTAIVAIAHVSNTLGNVYPVKQLCAKAKAVNALSVIDGTQAGAHIKIDVQDIACDFYALSGHKMYASTGIGILYGKSERLLALSAHKLGGEMIQHVTWHDVELQKPPLKFEAGTPNIAGALSMASTAMFIQKNFADIQQHEDALYHYLLEKLLPLVSDKKITFLGNTDKDSISLLSFYSNIEHANDIAAYLSSLNICVRAGHHCAMPLMQFLAIEGSVRISLACYNQKSDIEKLSEALNEYFYKDKAKPYKGNIIEEELKSASSWTEKHRLLLIYSKKLPLLPNTKCIEANEIKGCEAKVWLSYEQQQESLPIFEAYSDSKVVRGLLAVMLHKINAVNNSPEKAHNPLDDTLHDYLHDLGLQRYFSEGRRDGMKQVIKRMKELYSLLN